MKNIMSALLAILFAVNLYGASEAEEFFYKRGFEAGYNQGYDEGVKQAMQSAKDTLAKYKDSIRAYEIGKYLVKSQRITYPQVWQERDASGGVKISVQQSEIVDEFNIEDIFAKFGTLPKRDPADIENIDTTARNSVYLSSRDHATNSMPSASDREKNINTLTLKKTWRNEDILKKANLVYADDGDSYKVIFFSSQEKQDFCKSFGVCK